MPLLFKSWAEYMASFCRVGGIIEAAPTCMSHQMASPSIAFLIEPDGQVQVIGSMDRFTARAYVNAGCFFPQQSLPNMNMMTICKSIGDILYEKGVIGHVTVDLVSFPDPTSPSAHPLFWAVDLNCNLTDYVASCLFFDFLMVSICLFCILIFNFRRANLTSWLESTQSITPTKVYSEETAPTTPAPVVVWVKVKMMITSACRKEAIAAHKTHLRRGHPITKLLAGQTTTQLQNTNVTFQNSVASCTASTSITQAFQKYNTRPSSTCADCNQFLSTWSQERAQLSCYKTAFSPVCWPWWR